VPPPSFHTTPRPPWRLAIAVALGLRQIGAQAQGPEPDATEILRQVAARARAVSGDTHAPWFSYPKVSVHHHLDSDGAVKDVGEKLYQVTLTRGMTHNRLVAVDGRNLSESESRERSERERQWRESFAAGKRGSATDRLDALVNEEFIARFQFTWTGRERIRDRSCHVLHFAPRPGPLPEERLMDRVLHRLHGRIWVDETTHELARVEAATVGVLRVWGGLLGSLEALEFHLEREASDFGVWFNRHLEVEVRGRRLFSQLWIRARETAGPLQPLPKPPPEDPSG
jgi:hypothetical protein